MRVESGSLIIRRVWLAASRCAQRGTFTRHRFDLVCSDAKGRRVQSMLVRRRSGAAQPLGPAEDGAVIDVDAASLLAQYLLDDGDVLLVLDEYMAYEEQLHLVLCAVLP